MEGRIDGGMEDAVTLVSHRERSRCEHCRGGGIANGGQIQVIR